MLELDGEFARGILFVTLIGKLTEDTVNIFKNQLLNLINKSGINNLVINMDNIESVDDKGLKEIKEIEKILKINGGNLTMCNIPHNIKNNCLI